METLKNKIQMEKFVKSISGSAIGIGRVDEGLYIIRNINGNETKCAQFSQRLYESCIDAIFNLYGEAK
ncbi:MAG: hypothetical protein Q8P15_00440 [Nanoarchaeota archaeon]|nr:hypothetical protein [Nanoarchaeota archaeon]